MLDQPNKLLTLYPYIGARLQAMVTPSTYLYLSGAATLILWAITCLVVFENPVETFLNKILSDARRQSQTETQAVEDKSELLDAMYENSESQQETLAHVKDLICVVRSDVKDIEPLKQMMEKTASEITNLKATMRRMESNIVYTQTCTTCGEPVRLEFKFCPHCAQPTKGVQLPMAPVINLKNYK